MVWSILGIYAQGNIGYPGGIGILTICVLLKDRGIRRKITSSARASIAKKSSGGAVSQGETADAPYNILEKMSNFELLKIRVNVDPAADGAFKEAVAQEWERRNLPIEEIERLKTQLIGENVKKSQGERQPWMVVAGVFILVVFFSTAGFFLWKHFDRDSVYTDEYVKRIARQEPKKNPLDEFFSDEFFTGGQQDSAATYNARGVAHKQEGKLDQAIEDFTRAIELYPTWSEAYNNRGTTYGHAGKLDKAIEDLTKAIELGPNAIFYNNRALTYGVKGDLDRALSDYTKAIELNPNYALAYFSRGNIYYLKQEYKKTKEDFISAEKLGYKISSEKKEVLEELLKDA